MVLAMDVAALTTALHSCTRSPIVVFERAYFGDFLLYDRRDFTRSGGRNRCLFLRIVSFSIEPAAQPVSRTNVVRLRERARALNNSDKPTSSSACIHWQWLCSGTSHM